MSVLDAVLRLLKKEEEQLDRELSGITAAIAAFRKTYVNSKSGPSLSASRRKRIAAVPRTRSAKAQKTQKVVSIKSKRTLLAGTAKKAAPSQKARSAKMKAKKSA